MTDVVTDVVTCGGDTGDVLAALSCENKDLWMVPYRNSKLTHLLRYVAVS
jgi:hypothetical protein